MNWLIKGARPLGGQPADILIDGQVIAAVTETGSRDRRRGQAKASRSSTPTA